MALLLAAAIALPTAPCLAQSLQGPVAPMYNPSASHKPKPHGKKSAPVAETPQAAPVPPTLEQQPPVAPQVTYRDGQLTIDSANATLSQVLHSVQTQTGASLEMPPGAGGERVVATLGPGAPKDVLASLLNGSKFNYVILGEPNRPGAVQKVILLAKSTSGGGGDAATTKAPINSPPVQPVQDVEPNEEEYVQPEPVIENQPVPGQPGSEQFTPGPGPGARTPEQMLQELQRMQQQQQQLNPANQQQSPFPGQPPAPQPQ